MTFSRFAVSVGSKDRSNAILLQSLRTSWGRGLGGWVDRDTDSTQQITSLFSRFYLQSVFILFNLKAARIYNLIWTIALASMCYMKGPSENYHKNLQLLSAFWNVFVFYPIVLVLWAVTLLFRHSLPALIRHFQWWGAAVLTVPAQYPTADRAS